MNTAAFRLATTLVFAGTLCVIGCEQKKAAPAPAAQVAAPAKPTPAPPPTQSSTASAPAIPTQAKPPAAAATETAVSPYVLDFKVNTIDGREQDLSAYKGKVVVIVNVASKCGFTKQYEGLQELYSTRKDKGLVVLGFPANDFGHQEPGTEQEIQEFCSKTFDVNFPMFSKVTVKGEGTHPLYKRLADQPAPIGGAPKWNFTKFVVDKQGNVVARFDAEKAYVGTANLEPGLVAKVDELLKS